MIMLGEILQRRFCKKMWFSMAKLVNKRRSSVNSPLAEDSHINHLTENEIKPKKGA